MSDVFLRIALEKLVNAALALSELDENKKTYFEASPTKDLECEKRWFIFSDALRAARYQLKRTE